MNINTLKCIAVDSLQTFFFFAVVNLMLSDIKSIEKKVADYI